MCRGPQSAKSAWPRPRSVAGVCSSQVGAAPACGGIGAQPWDAGFRVHGSPQSCRHPLQCASSWRMTKS